MRGRKEVDPVWQEWQRISTALRHFRSDGYPNVIDHDYEKYLAIAVNLGLTTADIVDSCYDLTATLTTDTEIQLIQEAKIQHWETLRRGAWCIQRNPRTICLNLDPSYFDGILFRKKSFEGRAWVPASPYQLHDLREGDSIIFTLVERESWHWDERRQLGLSKGMTMVVDVGRVLFAPLVHWMYSFNGCDGSDFQPEISGASEILRLRQAAIYYTFPDYRQRIQQYGFVGIEVKNPRIIE